MTQSQENRKLIETVLDKAYTLDLLDRDFKSTDQKKTKKIRKTMCHQIEKYL